MISTKLPPCNIKSMSYANDKLTLQFNKYSRTYIGVPTQLAYKLFYAKNGSVVMDIFSNEIKNKFNVIEVR